jgi:hypothetical protein
VCIEVGRGMVVYTAVHRQLVNAPGARGAAGGVARRGSVWCGRGWAGGIGIGRGGGLGLVRVIAGLRGVGLIGRNGGVAGMGIGGAFGAREWAEHDVEISAGEFGRGVGLPVGDEFADEFFERLEAELLVGHFASPEAEGSFDFHFLAEEIDGMAKFNFEVVGIDGGGELDFLHAVGVLMFFGLLLSFGDFVAVLAEIDQTADGRGGVGGNLDQVDLMGPCEVDGFAERQHADLLAIDADHPDLTGTNFPVDPGERAARGWRTEIGALQDTPNG